MHSDDPYNQHRTACAYWLDNEGAVTDVYPCMGCDQCIVAMADARHDTALDIATHAEVEVPLTFCAFWADELRAESKPHSTGCGTCAMCECARLNAHGLTVTEAEISALALSLSEACARVRGVWQ